MACVHACGWMAGCGLGICMVSTFSREWINREKDPARRQLNRENCIFSFPRSRLRTWSSETGSAVPFCASLLILDAQIEFSAYSRDSSRFSRRRPHIPSIAIGSVSNLSDCPIAYRWRSLPKVHWHRASIPQGSSSDGCCLFRFYHEPIFCAPFFSHTLYWYGVDMCDTESIQMMYLIIMERVLVPLLFEIFFAALFTNVACTRFKADKGIMDALLVLLRKTTGAGGRGEQPKESQPRRLCCEACCTLMMPESPRICPHSS